MRVQVLAVIYNMLSCHDWTTLKHILTLFKESEHEEVKEAIKHWKEEGVVYSQVMRDDQGRFTGEHHLIDWDKFDYEIFRI